MSTMRTAIHPSMRRYAALVTSTALAACVAAQSSGCSSGAPQGPATSDPSGTAPGDTGSLGLRLSLPGGETLASVQWSIKDANGTTVQQGNVPVQSSTQIAFVVSGLAAGTGYTIALSGTTVDGTVTCTGSATFAVSARATTNVNLLLECNAPVAKTGSASINGVAFDCASVAAVSEIPSETTLGGSVSFAAAAIAANQAGVTYAWSASSGSFSAPSAANTSFTCSSAGAVTVTLTVADGPVPDGGMCDPRLSTQTFQVQCDPANCGAWTSLTAGASGTEVPVGETITLTATATGADPENLGYTWSSSDGTVGVLGTAQDEAAGPSDANTFLCTAPGTATVTVTVDDGPIDGGSCPSALTTVSKTVTCDAVPAGQVQSAWVELGAGGAAVARAITAGPSCPTITIDGSSQPMSLRAGAATEPLRSTTSTSLGPQFSKPSVFPVSACETALPSTAANVVVGGRALPLPKANPTRIVLIGDSGCRMKAAIPSSGSQFQGCNDPTQYPFQQLSTLAASLKPDLVLHVGDYQYRENECPPNQANCAGSPWGYGWDTWEADFFHPAADLLAAAPWIVVRGNHEQCTRAGQGWFRFLDPAPYTEARSCNAAANDAVLQADGTLFGGAYSPVYAVPVGANSQVIVFDSNNVGATAVTAGGSSNFLTYQSELQAAAALATSKSTYNIWANHHPILGYAPNAGAPPAGGNLDLLSVMQANFPTSYFPPNVNLAVHGHVHLFEGIDFTSTNYPATIVSGNAGTLLDVALPDPFPSATVHPDPAGNVTVSTIADTAGFGFMLLEYKDSVWVATEYRLDGTVRTACTVQLDGQMTCTVNNFIN
jgi:hypothetical protein